MTGVTGVVRTDGTGRVPEQQADEVERQGADADASVNRTEPYGG